MTELELTRFTPDDRGAVRAYVDLVNAVRRADSPWEHELTERWAVGDLSYGWDLEPAEGYLATAGGEPVAVALYETSEYDNTHLAQVWPAVHPAHRRRGHGSGVLDALVARAREEGRKSVLTVAWESEAAAAFAARHGLEPRTVSVMRRQVLAELDWAGLDAAYADALPHAAAYRLERWPAQTPEADLPALAEMTAAINDAPTDDLDIEDNVFPPERIRGYETASASRGLRLRRLVARHVETGALAGQTVIAVEEERPELAEQHDTSVLAAHRGHRLGLLLKIEMLRWLRESEPQIAIIDTWNAASNEHMIAVNELLGYRVVGRETGYQRDL